MSVIGTVKNGVIELPPDAQLEEGQRVEIVAASLSHEDAFVLRETVVAAPRVRELPDDLAPNLDYYLHGHDHKQQPRRGRWIPAAQTTPELTTTVVVMLMSYRHCGRSWDALLADVELHAYRQRRIVRSHRSDVPGARLSVPGHLHAGRIIGTMN